MGCCARAQDNVANKSSNIPLNYQESLDKKEKNLENSSNIPDNTVIPKKIMKSDKTSDLKIQIGKIKTENKNIKSMNALKRISYNEVNGSKKYFSYK